MNRKRKQKKTKKIQKKQEKEILLRQMDRYRLSKEKEK